MVKHGETKTKEFQRVSQLMRTLPTLQVDDPGFMRINYLRYADDWIVGIWGSHALAEQIKQEIKTLLSDHLRLTLSGEKTHITHARTEEALFLGTMLKLGAGAEAKLTLQTNMGGKKFKRRCRKHADIDLIQSEMHMRSRSSIAKPCCIYGETLDKVQIEMHHVRHIRKLSDKRQAVGFNRMLRMLNRKQIPVCKICHEKIHRGKYDNLKLSDMAYVPR